MADKMADKECMILKDEEVLLYRVFLKGEETITLV